MSANETDNRRTIFAPGCHIKGGVTVEGNVLVLGSLEGPVHVTGTLEIAAEGGIRGDIVTHTLVNRGRIEGDVTCTRAELVTGGRLAGNLTAKALTVAEGADWRGGVVIGNKQADRANDQIPVTAPSKNEPPSCTISSGPVTEVKPPPTRTAVTGLLRRRHELLSR